MNTRAKKGTEGDRRFTLPSTLALVKQLAGVEHFDLDPCADRAGPQCAHTGIYLATGGDGLLEPWFGRVFVNPPWSDIEPWVERAWGAFAYTNTSCVAMLLPDNRQGTAWWQRYVERFRDGRRLNGCQALTGHDITVELTTRYLPGRPRYGTPSDPAGRVAGSPPFGSVVLVWKRVTH